MTKHIEDMAKDLAGNHRKFESFGWHTRPEDDQNWCIVYTSTRDSGLLDQSNARVIEKTLAPFTEGDDPDCVSESHGHWAVGHVDGYAIRVYRRNGEITTAFKAYAELALSLQDYPCLDEMDYSEREYEAAIEGIRQAAHQFTHDDLPEGWEEEVYSWLAEHDPRALEDDGQDQGAYPDDDEIAPALLALGYHEDCPDEAD